jgi:adenylate cyclase
MGWALLVALVSAAVVLAARSAWVELGWLPLGVAVSLLGSGVTLATGVHLAAALPLISCILVTAGAMGFNYLSADRERQRMQTMFSRYVSKLVVDQLASQPELPRLDGENREVTAFFSDIRKFSTFSEKFKDDPRTLVHLLNTYLTRVSGTLLKHGACLDKYIGDAVVCIFGAPLPQADHAVRACRAALEVQQEVTRLRQEYAAKGLPDVYTRVGMNSAVMFVGNFGSEQLFNYTAMGDGMNLASRLEGANKAYETLIMIGPRTFELARDFIEARELDLARVAGKTEAVAVYELMALKGGLSDLQGQARELYVRGLALYRAGRFQEALESLEQALKLLPGDGPSRVLAMRCRKFSEHPPPHFDGVIDLDK